MMFLLERPCPAAWLLCYFPPLVVVIGALALLLSPWPVRAYVWSVYRAVKVTPYGVMTSFSDAFIRHGLINLAKGLWCPRHQLEKDVEEKFSQALSSSGGSSGANRDDSILISYSCRTIFYCIIRALLEKKTAEKGDRGEVKLRICTCSLHFGSFYKLLKSMKDKNGSSLIEFYEIDLKQEDWTLDESLIDEAEVSNCDLILCQNLFGIPFEQERLFELGKQKNIPVIEDCVQSGSLFGKYKGHPLADVHIWSGGLDKTPACLGGGFARFSSDGPHGQFLHERCVSIQGSFPIETISERVHRLISQTLHLMIAKNSFQIINAIGMISTLFIQDSKKLSLHEMALAIRKDKSMAPFQHSVLKFCKQPSTYNLLSMQYGLSRTETYLRAIEREHKGFKLLLGSIPESYRNQLFPMLTDKAMGVRTENRGISEFTWVVADGIQKRYQLADFLVQHGFIPLINTTWDHSDSNCTTNEVAKKATMSLLYLPNILELREHQIVLLAQALTKWCKQQETTKSTKKRANNCFTMKEVALHCTSDDFWTVVDGQVFDLTGFSDLHPGGSIIMNAAGADGTVLFHQYHLFNRQVAKSKLSNYRIGSLAKDETESPTMGEFYETVASRVKGILNSVPRRPTAAKLSWAMDASIMTSFLVLSYFVHTDWPLWALVVMNIAVPTMSSLRMEGQQHANGHMQIFGPRVSWWAELYGYLLGVPAMFSYGVPSAQKNARRALYQPRKQAQFEFPEGRGFAEHMAIHHVRGAELEHDQCFKLVSVMGILRLSDKQPYLMPWMHHCQHHLWFNLILDTVVEAADCTKIPFFVPRIRYAIEYLLLDGEYMRGFAILLGTFSSLAISWCYLALPMSGWVGFGCFICCSALKEYLGLFGVQVFFAQHVWDNSTEKKVANADWGRYNAESCYSWWGQHRDVWLYPFLWGTGGGRSCPSTLTYHLEHTLFPGVNYMYLPAVSSIVRSTCDEFGIKYNRFVTSRDLLRERQKKLRLYSSVPRGLNRNRSKHE